MNTAIVTLVIYGVVMFGWQALVRKKETPEFYGLADRRLGGMTMVLSIAATWLWGQAVLVSAQTAFNMGAAGFFWFTVPNIAALALFGVIVRRIQSKPKLKAGMTLSSNMAVHYSSRVGKMFAGALIVVQTAGVFIQLSAGAFILEKLMGLPYNAGVIAMAVIVTAYTVRSGFIASVKTDALQMVLVLAAAVTIAVYVFGVGQVNITEGFSGVSGNHALFGPLAFTVFLTYGLGQAIGLITGPVGDQMYWQRAYATNRIASVAQLFGGAALAFAVPVLVFGATGFAAVAAGISPADTQLVSLDVIQQYVPAPLMTFITVALIAALTSTADSNLCAWSSMWLQDFRVKGTSQAQAVVIARIAMVMFVAVGVIIAMLRIPIAIAFLTYITIRATMFAPTLAAVLGRRAVSERAVFYSMIAGVVIGAPMYLTGFATGNAVFSVVGALSAVGLPAIGVVLGREGKQ